MVPSNKSGEFSSEDLECLEGWTQGGLVDLFHSSFLQCVTNLVLAVTVCSRYKITLDGVATLYEGNCATVKRADSVIHILINVLAALLLGASNLTLQMIAAPARREVDRAHARGVWLDIGVTGFRNLWQLSRTSVVLWCFLAISSISIHFL